MNFIYILSGLFYTIAILAFLVIVGFLITWLVGKINKSKLVQTVGKRGSLITSIVLVAFLVLGVVTQIGYQQVASKMNTEFDNTAQRYETLYLTTAEKAEKVGNSEQKSWSDGIDNSEDDFNPDNVIAKSMAKNVDNIDDINNNMQKLKRYLAYMKRNTTEDRNLKKYQKSYSELKKFTNLVTSPSGSYNSFTDSFNNYDVSTAEAYKELH